MKKILSILLVACMLFSGFAMAEETVADTYSYDLGTTSFPTVWDPLRYQTATDGIITDYVTSSFYAMDYNETMDGYAMVPGMAVGEPVDVTADYVGQFGIVEGDTAKAYIINLREDLKWEDGTPITAHDFVESAKRLLAPEAQNYRADGMYSGSVKIVNAEAYLKQGQTVKQDNSLTGVYALADLVKGEDGEFKFQLAENGLIRNRYENEARAEHLNEIIKTRIDYLSRKGETAELAKHYREIKFPAI